MSSIQLVVFDIAGTTIRDNGHVADAFISAFHDFGFEMPVAEIKKVMGFRKIDAIALLLGQFAPEFKDDDILIDRIHTVFIDRMIEFYRNDEGLAPLPHTEEVFAALHRKGIRIALNTGFTRIITETILHRLRWDNRHPYIARVISSDEVTNGRPAPDMIQTLMADLDIATPDRVLKIGDTEVDIEEGRNAGCGVVVSVTTGAYTRHQLEAFHPDFIIDDLRELLPIVEKA